MRILLAIDESEYSKAALAAVKTGCNPAQSEVLVLHVLDLLTTYAGMTPIDPNALERLYEDERRAGQALVERADRELKAAGFKTSTLLRKGDARGVILDVAAEWKADRVVLGSHGKKGMKRLLLGSVSEAVARHAPCSVQIVRLPAAK